jgi:hypothetical protein
MFAPGKSPTEMQPEILDIFLSKVYVGSMDYGTGFSPCHERIIRHLGFINLYSPFI